MKTAALIAVALLAGCQLTQEARPGPEVYEGNASSVIVGWNHSKVGASGALGVADRHCGNYGKTARYSGKPNAFLLAYDCITP